MPCSNRSISPAGLVLSSKPVAAVGVMNRPCSAQDTAGKITYVAQVRSSCDENVNNEFRRAFGILAQLEAKVNAKDIRNARSVETEYATGRARGPAAPAAN